MYEIILNVVQRVHIRLELNLLAKLAEIGSVVKAIEGKNER